MQQNERCEYGDTNVRDEDFQHKLQFSENFTDTIQLSDYSGLALEAHATNTAVFQVDNSNCNDNSTSGLNVELDYKEQDVEITMNPSNETANHTYENSHGFYSSEYIRNQSMFNPDQVSHDFVTDNTSDQLGEQVPSDNPTTERSLGSEDIMVSQTITPTAESDQPGASRLTCENDSPGARVEESMIEKKPQVNAMDLQVSLPSDSLSVRGAIQDCQTLMLVDTGASVTAVSNTFLSNLCTPPKLQSSSLPSIRTVSGEQLPVLGQATLPFLIGETVYTFDVLVIDNLTYPVVLGRDFLMQFGSVIDLQGHTLILGTAPPVTLHSSVSSVSVTNNDTPVTVHAFATYILPPLSESVIPVYPKSSLPVGNTGLIEPNSQIATRYHVCGASQLVSLSEQHTFPFRVLNPTNKPVTIYRCSTMGTFTPSAASMSVIATADTPSESSPLLEDEETVPLDLSETTLDDHQITQLKSLIAEYRDIFALKPEELGRTGLIQHRIDTGDNPPIRQRPYRVAETQRGIIEEHVTDMLNRGIIQPSTSPWASPIILVKKKDGTDRFVVDFRRLNAVTHKDSYPLPRIDDALHALNGTKYFSSMDLMSGYWQVEMEPESREHTAFITYGGLYEFLVVLFGLTNAPSTYQRLMECVLRNLTYKICLIYLDDILVYSRTFDDHLCHLRQVFDRLRLANLKLKTF